MRFEKIDAVSAKSLPNEVSLQGEKREGDPVLNSPSGEMGRNCFLAYDHERCCFPIHCSRRVVNTAT